MIHGKTPVVCYNPYMAVLAILTAALIAVHLWSRHASCDAVGNVTKPFLMPMLYGTMFAIACRYGIGLGDCWLIVAAAAMYTLGDILLIPREKPACFVIGAVSFMAGHMLYVAYFVRKSFSLPFLIAGIIISALPFAVYMHKVKRKNPEAVWTFALYGAAIWVLFSGVAASFSLSDPFYAIVALSGVILFGYSDSRIAYNIVKHRSTSDFEIMWTYIAANFFLAASVLLSAA